MNEYSVKKKQVKYWGNWHLAKKIYNYQVFIRYKNVFVMCKCVYDP